MKLSTLEVSSLLAFGQETGTNEGPFCRMVQAVANGRPKDPWCAHYVSTCLFIAHQGAPPLRLSGGCDELLKACRALGLERSTPTAPGLFFVMKTPTDAEHVGFVLRSIGSAFETREGNAADKTKPETREGRVVAERTRLHTPGKYVYCALPPERSP